MARLTVAAPVVAFAADPENGLPGRHAAITAVLVVASVLTVLVIVGVQTAVVRRVGRDGRAAALGAGLAWLLWGGACAGMLLGNTSVNVLPRPSSLCNSMWPPSIAASSREIDSPRPVPPKRRLVVPSA